MPPSDEVGCFLWFHTGFISETITHFTKDQIDMACSDQKCRIFDNNFKLSFYFSDVPTAAHTFMSPQQLHQMAAAAERDRATDQEGATDGVVVSAAGAGAAGAEGDRNVGTEEHRVFLESSNILRSPS